MRKLQKLYNEWRDEMEGFLAEGLPGSTDCGEQVVRADFSDWAGLKKEISFEKMLELEKNYDNQ